jgi:hypothetical protein
MNGVDMILRERHGNRLSVIALDHLEPGQVSLTVVPGSGDYLSMYGASFDLTVDNQIDLIKALLANLNQYAPARVEEIIDHLTPAAVS